MILGGDIGGTKTNLALFEIQGDTLTLKVQERYPSHDHNSLDEIVQDFMQKHPTDIQSAAFGIAGPVRNEEVKTTNLPWDVRADSLSKIVKGKVHLINDLEANAWGISILKEEELSTLNTGDAHAVGNRALISAGTGLGEAGLYFDGQNHMPFACEGGHVDFAPTSELEIRLLAALSKEFGHVSYERVLSGQGLHNLYNFLLKDKGAKPPEALSEEMQQKDPSYVISEQGLAGTDPLCQEALDLMVRLYGSAAGNLALKFMAYGGVYLGGGIAPKILEKLHSSRFLEAFLAKGRFRGLLEQIPIHVILNDKAALLGAGQCALYQTKQKNN